MIAPVKFHAIQKGYGTIAPVALYNAWTDFGPFAMGTTTTRNAIEKAGYRVPPSQLLKESEAWTKFYSDQLVASGQTTAS